MWSLSLLIIQMTIALSNKSFTFLFVKEYILHIYGKKQFYPIRIYIMQI
jgi:hypothetical protein